jgi:hypothetical protein
MQVPAAIEDSCLSTRTVDKTVHDGFASRPKSRKSGLGVRLAKKTPTELFPYETTIWM